MLKPINPGIQPVGIFDMNDAQLASLKGGEVMTLGSASKSNSLSESAAADVLDGYVTASTRAMATLASSAAHSYLALADEGSGPDYFTMLGSVVGGRVGMIVSAGANNGPHTALASGKVTLWDKPGLYEVSIDACSAGFLAGAVGLLVPGDVLGHTNAGKLAISTTGAVAGTGCASFAEFSASQSLVTTPRRLVGAVETVDRMLISFAGAMLNDRTVA
jgi:hypothetical protein